MKAKAIIDLLRMKANPDIIIQKELKFGVKSKNALGIYHKDLKEIARTLPKDVELANQLFDTGIYEARLLCSKILKPKDITNDLLEKWVVSFENWEICDSFCMGLVAKSKFAIPKIYEWVEREEEFVKRAAFTTIAAYCMADKYSGNEVFIDFLQLIKRDATDHRLYVKKAVNWALRNIGKRNTVLKEEAIQLASELSENENNAARWVGINAFRELTQPGVRISGYPKEMNC